jgi:hypothetical protein
MGELAPPQDDNQARGVRLLLLSKGAVFARTGSTARSLLPPTNTSSGPPDACLA